MLLVAAHINEYKKRNDAVGRIVNKKESTIRRDSTRSISSSVTKKLLRSSQKAKNAIGLGDPTERDDIFDTLVALVETTRSAVLRFSNEMRDWSRATRAALEAQVTMVSGWIELYAPMGDEKAAHPSHHRLVVFLEEVLMPLIEEPWRELVSLNSSHAFPK
jgi:hypothetical protein